jgi:hypothetical protein
MVLIVAMIATYNSHHDYHHDKNNSSSNNTLDMLFSLRPKEFAVKMEPAARARHLS